MLILIIAVLYNAPSR